MSDLHDSVIYNSEIAVSNWTVGLDYTLDVTNKVHLVCGEEIPPAQKLTKK